MFSEQSNSHGLRAPQAIVATGADAKGQLKQESWRTELVSHTASPAWAEAKTFAVSIPPSCTDERAKVVTLAVKKRELAGLSYTTLGRPPPPRAETREGRRGKDLYGDAECQDETCKLWCTVGHPCLAR